MRLLVVSLGPDCYRVTLTGPHGAVVATFRGPAAWCLEQLAAEFRAPRRTA